MCVLVWLASAGAFSVVLLWEHSNVGAVDVSCAQVGDSNFSSSHWQWLPPGRVCDDESITDAHPSALRLAIIAVIVGAAVVLSATALKRPSGIAPTEPADAAA